MPKRTSDYDTWLLAELADPEVAASYLNAAICEDPDLLPVALKNVAKARRTAGVAGETSVSTESLSTMLSESGNPTLTNLSAILKALGLRIVVVPESRECVVEPLKVEGELPTERLIRERR